jgi:hypothetical protein
MLADSGLTDPVINRRGYRSSESKSDLAKLGFGAVQQLHPALIVPLYDVRSQLDHHQIRPDRPRAGSDGRAIKYESPRKSRNVLDVHPDALGLVANPEYPLIVTEGVKKADSCVSKLSVPAIALTGVYGWRGRNADDGLTALADWELVPLNREVLVIFDSDIMHKEPVLEACRRLGTFLSARGSDVWYVQLPDGEHGAKYGLDDFLVAGKRLPDLRALSSSEPPRSRIKATTEPADTYDDLADESGAELADALVTFFNRFVVFQSDAQVYAIVLWCFHDAAIDAFDSTARLGILSAEPESAKTRVLEILRLFVVRPWYVIKPSTAATFRTIEHEHPTLLLDEVDGLFDPKGNPDPDLQTMLCTGHRRGASVPRCVGENQAVHNFDVFGVVAYAGIGRVADVLLSRSVLIRMQRRAPDQKCERFYERRVAALPVVEDLRRRLAAWGQRHRKSLADAEPVLPVEISDRAADVWEPLLACADAIGGDWPKRAREAARKLNGEQLSERQSVGIELLRDLHTVFGAKEQMATQDILPALCNLDESSWKDMNGRPITARWLAKTVKPYGVVSRQHRFSEDDTRKGYHVDDGLYAAWQRYCPDPSTEGNRGNKGNAPGSNVSDVSPVSDTKGGEKQQATRGPRRVKL